MIISKVFESEDYEYYQAGMAISMFPLNNKADIVVYQLCEKDIILIRNSCSKYSHIPKIRYISIKPK